MLQMKCPECDATIRSSFLVEMGTITCDQCQKEVTVKDVVVTTEDFTMQRDTLLNRINHYRALLEEVERKKMSLGDNEDLSPQALQSLNHNYSALRELLEASRGNYRLPITKDLPLDIKLEGNTINGDLLNLSTKGATIKAKRLCGFPQKGSEITLRLSLPGNEEHLSIAAKIAWIGKRNKDDEQNNITMGVSFINLHGKTHTHIWDYIVGSHENS